MKTKVQELYEEWCGEDRHVNDCHPVHDSSETIEFAEYYYNAMKELEKETYGKVMTIGAGDFEQKVHIEAIQQLVRDRKNVVFITGHNLPPADILAGIVEGVKQKHPEFFDEDKLFAEPMKIHPFNAPLEIPELTYSQPERRKGHERPFKFHK